MVGGALVRTTTSPERTEAVTYRANARRTASDEFERQVEQTRSSSEENLATRETSLRNELSELREEQSKLRQGFQEQTEKAQRLSGVLDNLGSVFSRKMGEPTP